MKLLFILFLLISSLSWSEDSLMDIQDCIFLDMEIDLKVKAWQETKLPPEDISKYLETQEFSKKQASEAADLIAIYNRHCLKYLKEN